MTAAKAIGIELRGEHYSKLVVEADHPEDQISLIGESSTHPRANPGSPVWPLTGQQAGSRRRVRGT